MTPYIDKEETNKLTPKMKEVLLLLHEEPKTDSELIEKIPNLPLEILGELRELEAIDHNGHLVYITSIGEKLLKQEIL
jgi:predicted transcriptional regulator